LNRTAFQTAFEFHSKGDFAKALELYLNILQGDPDHFDVLHLCGLVAYQTGRLDEAEIFFLKARGVKSDFAPLHSNYGLTLQTQNRLAEAVASYDAAIMIKPDYHDAFNHRGSALKALGWFDEALASYEKSVLSKPDYAEGFNGLANALLDMERFEEALAGYDKALLIKQDFADAYNNRGVALQKMSRPQEALNSYEKAIFYRRDHAEAYNNRGNALRDLGRFDEALGSYDRAIFIKNDHAGAFCNQGLALQDMGRLEEALASYQRAVSIRRDYAEAYNNYAIALQKLMRLDEALAQYDMAIIISPAYVQAFNNRGNALKEMNRFDEALASYDKAILINHDHAEAYNNLGLTLRDLDRFDEALVCYDQAVAIKPDYSDAFYNRGYVLKDLKRFDDALMSFRRMIDLESVKAPLSESYKIWLMDLISIDFLPAVFGSQAELDASWVDLVGKLGDCLRTLGASHVSFAPQQSMTDRFVFNLNGFFIAYLQKNMIEVMKNFSSVIRQALAIPPYKPLTKARRPGRIRFGLASSLLKSHNGANWAYNWLAHLPRDYDFFTYAFNADSDEMTEKFAALGTHRSLRFGKNAIEVMRAHELDILMLPDVGMTPTSRILSCHRIAPIQFTAWGHPVTSGAPEIDFFLSSDLMEPEDAQSHYSERLVRLPNLALYLNPPAPRQILPCSFDLPTGRVLYGCLQSLFKYLPQYDHVLPMIAKGAPEAVFVFLEGNPPYTTSTLRRRLSDVFASFGLDARDHVKILPSVSRDGYLDLMSRMDVILDSIGWTGGNTSLQAVELGKPIVTLPGEFMRGRHTYAMFRMMGLESQVAVSPEDYVLKAIRLGADTVLRQQVEQEILGRKHLLYQDQTFIGALDSFLKTEFAKLAAQPNAIDEMARSL